MKKLLYILILAALPFSKSIAQSAISDQLLQNCKKELDDIATKKVDIHDIAFNTDGHWLILYGDIGYSYSFIPSPLENMLTKLNSEGTNINKSVIMSDSSWILVYGDKQYTSQNINPDISTDLTSAANHKKNIKCLAISQGCRLTVYGTNGFIAKGIPPKMAEKLEQVNKKKWPVREAAFYQYQNQEGWVLLYGKRGIAFQNLPDDITAQLQKFVKQGKNINLVRFYGNKWIIIYDGYKSITNI